MESSQITTEVPDPEPELNEYGSMDKLSIPFYEKEKGTHHFAKKEYSDAIKAYSKALLGISFLAKDGQLTDTSQLQKYQDELLVPCNLNLALCYMKLNEYSQALQFCETALKIQPHNIKGLYRKGLCLLKDSNFKEARIQLQRAISLDPTNQDLLQTLEDVSKREQASKEREKKMSEQMIAGLDYSQKQVVESEQTFLQKVWSRLFCRKRKTTLKR